ncbi:hypothetical protein [Pedobacter metabolipauper]|uniref:LTXXQ motif family protein n=1 Tax=Pedobacter metabolipauper TaxID=425513 RepID=A0A4R6SQ90_9SPHI|nr:hypothetical protein [Pedobacter metabolipauper]TDQ06929.1 hypothetical protein ATK78_3942 [Pedobacter metabolipauper]
MRKLIFTAILFISMGTMAFAQQGKGKKESKTPEQRSQHAAEALTKKLSLSADQKSKVYAINLESFNKAKANHVKGEKPDKAVMKAALEDRDHKISAVLNDTQLKAYQDLKADRKKAMKGRGKKGKDHTAKKV